MDERRKVPRDKVIYGAVAAIDERSPTVDCVVRNISEQGARIEFSSSATFPEQFHLTVARLGRSFLARVVWWRDNSVGLAFQPLTETATVAAPDLQEQLRRSEVKRRQLENRMRRLIEG